MSISNFQIRSGASVPYLEVTITKDGRVGLYQQATSQGCAQDTSDPNAVDLTDATVTFAMWKCGRVAQQVAVQGMVTIVDAKNGIVRYEWHPSDTAITGYYYGTFIVTFSNNSRMLWPYIRESLTIEVTQ